MLGIPIALEALTHEKVFIVASPEFGSLLEGHVLLIEKALCLRSSGAWWHDERLADLLSGWADYYLPG